jgi:hypothetical protein
MPSRSLYAGDLPVTRLHDATPLRWKYLARMRSRLSHSLGTQDENQKKGLRTSHEDGASRRLGRR